MDRLWKCYVYTYQDTHYKGIYPPDGRKLFFVASVENVKLTGMLVVQVGSYDPVLARITQTSAKLSFSIT